MANTLIKKRSYGYGYGYGYGPVPLSPAGKRNLAIATVVLLVGIGWLAFRFALWREGNKLNEAIGLWDRNAPVEAWERLATVRRWAVDEERYFTAALSMLVEKDPSGAYEYSRNLPPEFLASDLQDPKFFARNRLVAAGRARDWAALEEEIRANQILSDEDPTLLVERARLDYQNKQYDTAKQHLEAALDRNPYLNDARLLRSEIQAVSPNVMERNQALVSLREIAQQQGPDSVKASLLMIAGKLVTPGSSAWKTETERLSENPFLEYHYLLQRSDTLEALIATVGQDDPRLAYKLAVQQTKLPDAQPAQVARMAFFAQEAGLAADAKASLAAYLTLESDPDTVRWLQARQSLIEGDYRAAMQQAEAGANGERPQRYAQIFAALAGGERDRVPHDIRIASANTILSDPNLPLDQWQFAASQLWELAPESRPRLTKDALAKAQTPEDALRVAGFLLDHGMPSESLQALERSADQRSSHRGIELEFRALVAANQLDKAEAFLAGIDSLSETTRANGLLMLSLIRDDPQASKQRWDAAWQSNERSGSAIAFARLGDLCFEYGKRDWAEAAYRHAQAIDPRLPFPPASIARFSSLERSRGDTRGAKSILDVALSRNPTAPELRSEAAYLSILLNDGVLEAKDALRRVREEETGSELWSRAFALAQLRTGQADDALQTLSPYLERDGVDDSTLAVLYATLLANERESQADSLLPRIDKSSLLPEEVALIEEFAPVIVEEITLPETPEDERLYDRTNS